MSQAQQPEALQLAASLRQESESTSKGVRYSTAKYAAKELERQHARILELEADVLHKDAYAEQLGRALAAAQQAVQPAVPDGWKLVAVNPEFDNLMYWLGRCDEKGHLEQCPDLIEPWLVFDYDSKTNFSAPAHPAEVVPAQEEFPTGAIVNGRTHIERLEAHYQFECDAGSLVMCDDWNELKRYFEHLANWAYAATQPAAKGLDAQMVNMTPPATSRDRWMYEQGRLAEREIICAAIKAEDDHCVDQGDYMLDSDDCIKIVCGEWERPDFSGNAAQAKQGGA